MATNSDRAVMNVAAKNDLLTFAGQAVCHLDQHSLEVRPHVRLMAAVLEQLERGEMTKLILNLPPRLLKSRLATVCFTAWLIGKNPAYEVIIVCHDQTLADGLVDAIRDLVRAPWYAQVFPNVRLSQELSRTGHFRLTNGSKVLARSIEANATGQGAHLLIFDDPMDAGDANRAGGRMRVIELFNNKFGSRLQSQRDSKLLVVAQRLHRDDLCGYLSQRRDFVTVAVPLIAKEDVQYRIGDFSWNRPSGDVLDLDRYPISWIEDQERLNPPVFAAQYQQSPFLTESQILKREWIKLYTRRPPTEANNVTISVDCAASQKSGSSFTAMLVWATDGADHYLVQVVRARMLFPEMQERLLRLIDEHRPRTVLIEDMSTGQSLIPHITKKLVEGRVETSVKGVTPRGSKGDRLRQHLHVFADQHVLVPSDRAFGELFIDELMLFEESGYSDQVDATTQYLAYARASPGLNYKPIILGAGGSLAPQKHMRAADRPIDRSTFKKPMHGVPSLRDPSNVGRSPYGSGPRRRR